MTGNGRSVNLLMKCRNDDRSLRLTLVPGIDHEPLQQIVISRVVGRVAALHMSRHVTRTRQGLTQPPYSFISFRFNPEMKWTISHVNAARTFPPLPDDFHRRILRVESGLHLFSLSSYLIFRSFILLLIQMWEHTGWLIITTAIL